MQFEIQKAGSYDETGDDSRVSWPWRNMGIGDRVEIPEDLASRAQTGCHVYGHVQRKKFKTRKQKDGSLMVTRTG